MSRRKDALAIVTGGASGLGTAIGMRLMEVGYEVILTDVDERAGIARARELGCEFFAQDVADETHWVSLMEFALRRGERLNVLVNNAGIEGPFDAATPEDTQLSDWRAIQRVNVDGVFLGCRAAIPAMRRSGGGSIVNVSSTAALGATPDFTAYGASKAAVLQLTKSVALHCARTGSKIRCNSVHPGLIMTPMLSRIIAATAERTGVSTESVIQQFKSAIPQGEFQVPADVAHAVVFLASEEARHITGIAMPIDGGCMLGPG